MSKIGTGELLVILAVALLIFGPSKLPALGKMAGKAIGTLRHYADTDNWDELMDDDDAEDIKPAKTKKTAAKSTEAEEEAGEEAAEEPAEETEDQAS